MKNKQKLLLTFIAFCFISFSGFSQITNSGMNGTVVTETGENLIGATVVAVHEPSGTQYGTVTNVEGRFNLQGMRPGGPYSVKVSFVGYSTTSYTDVTLYLGESFILNAEIKQSAIDVLEVVVIGSKPSKFSTSKTGATTNISNEQMISMPSITRSIEDIARISPYANGMGFAGGDGRSTNFTVDGANFNNNFGLSSGLPGGGTPISLDAIEEVQVVIAPFDVRQTNFIGGGINAITKSGTNTFKGSAYTYLTNQNMRGNSIGDVDFGERDIESNHVYGATLGGPIIKNKLFFFVNGEYGVNPGQVVTWRPSTDGAADTENMLSRTSASDMELVKQHLIDNYGYDPGSYTDYPADESNRKLLARLDWNINDDNKLSFRYNYTKNQSWRPTNGNSQNAGSRNRAMDRISQYSMAFSNSIYSMDNIVNSYALDLNSKISDKISNQFLATYTKINDIRGSNSEKFPFIDIMNGLDEGIQIDEPYMSAGYELFTWNNGVNNNIINIVDNATYYVDNHKITAGLSFEHQMANNSYMRNATGYYRYASLDDFLNQAAPRDFALTYGYDGEQNPSAEVALNQYGVYAQDEWNINPDFKLTYGVRADYIKYVDNLIRNNAIYALDFDGENIDTGEWPTGNVQFSPRAGFTWDVMGDQTLKLRGGTGIFSGRLPLVFFTNMPTNSGMVQGSYAAVTEYDTDGTILSADDALADLAGPMITDVDEMISTLGLPNTINPDDGELPYYGINAIDPNFKMPQVWKTSLAVDVELPTSFPMTLTLEGMYTNNINGVMLKNANIKQADDTWTRFSGDDDRYIYPVDSLIEYTSTDAYILANNSEGWGAIGNITITAEPVKNMHLMAAFTRTESKEISGMPGSSASSAYSNVIQVNGPHMPSAQRSQYVIPSKAIASVSYMLPYANDHMSTSFNLFYIGYSAGGYSFTYENDMNGDGYKTDLIYIPGAKGDINFVSAADEDAFFSFVEQDSYLSSHKGEYAEAYAARAPWVHSFDLRVAQNFNINSGDTQHTLQLTLDFLNFGNLINNEWGVSKNMYNSNNGQILNYEGMDTNNVPSFSMATDDEGAYLTESYSTYYNYSQCWQLKVGARYLF